MNKIILQSQYFWAHYVVYAPWHQSRKPDFHSAKGEEKSGNLPILFWFVEFGIILRHINGMLILCCHVQCPCTCRFWQRFVLPTLDAVKLSHDNAFLLGMCTSNASSYSIAEFDSKRRWRKQSFMSRLVWTQEKIAQQRLFPLPVGTQREAQTSSSNCLVNIQVLLDSRFTH